VKDDSAPGLRMSPALMSPQSAVAMWDVTKVGATTRNSTQHCRTHQASCMRCMAILFLVATCWVSVRRGTHQAMGISEVPAALAGMLLCSHLQHQACLKPDDEGWCVADDLVWDMC
jgi:hypothetical protein